MATYVLGARHANKNAEVSICSGSPSAALALKFENHRFWRVREGGRFEDYLNRHGVQRASLTSA